MKRIHQNIFIYQSIIFFSILLLLPGCAGQSSSSNNTARQKSPDQSSVPYKKPPASFDDTVVIKSSAALFFNADSLQLDKIKEVLKKEEYETEVHNCFYLMRNARKVMKQYWPKLPIIETSRARYLLFIKKDKSQVLVDLDTKTDMCGIFLFDQKQDPELVDMMNIDTALGFYFKK